MLSDDPEFLLDYVVERHRPQRNYDAPPVAERPRPQHTYDDPPGEVWNIEIVPQDLQTLSGQEQSYLNKEDYLTRLYGAHVMAFDFYRDVFPFGFLQDRYRANPAAPHDGKYVSIANAIHEARDGHLYRKNHFVTNDLGWLLRLRKRVAFVAPCSFLAPKKDLDHLRFVHALVVDLDYVDVPQLRDLDHQITIGYVPRPTYIVNSGTGLHLYYLLDEPQRVYPNQQAAWAALKHALIDLCWNDCTSQGETRQYSGLVQPYRIVGSRSKLDCDPDTERVKSCEWEVTARRVGGRWTVDELLAFEPPTLAGTGPWEENITRARELFHPELDKNHVTLERARELWPEWYDRKILRNEPPRDISEYKWHVNPRVYEWWLRRIRVEAQPGHRYYCLMMLAVYAIKCDVSEERLRADAYGLLETFESRTVDESNHFKKSDVEQAIHAYRNVAYATLPIGSIEYFSGLRIERNQRRKGRKQEEHLRRARALCDLDHPDGSWREGNSRKGRPNKRHPKRDAILEYAERHPGQTQREIAAALGVSKSTVNKWLREARSQSEVAKSQNEVAKSQSEIAKSQSHFAT